MRTLLAFVTGLVLAAAAALLVLRGDIPVPAGRAEPAPAPVPPISREEIVLSFAPVVSRVTPAVVNIYASQAAPGRGGPFDTDPFFSDLFGGPAPVENSLGSGVIVRPDGIVVSNHHVVANATQIRAVLSDRREFDGEIILSDEAADIAVIRLDGAEDLPTLEFGDSDRIAVGDLVLAIGNPFGVGQTVTSGIVSGLARTGGPGDGGQGYFIQTDAAINPGNSGGALVDVRGRLVGINTWIISRSGGSQGIGFAIPANLVRQYVEQAEAGARELVRPWSGVEVQAVDQAIADALGLPAPRGVVVAGLHPMSPFAEAGLAEGDVVTAIGGLTVDSPQEMDFRLATLGAGTEADIVYWRGGRERTARVTLETAPGRRPDTMVLNGGTPLDGLAVAELTPALIEDLGLPVGTSGVVVIDVAGPAIRSRLRPGDILTGVDGVAIDDIGTLAAEMRNGLREIAVERGGQAGLLRFRG